MVLRVDPFREFDRLAEQMFASAAVPRAMPMDVYRSGDHYVLHCDLAGTDPGSLDINVEGSVLTIAARRQLTLSDDVDSNRIQATYENGVVTLTLPIREQAKPRRTTITGTGDKALEGSVVTGRT